MMEAIPMACMQQFFSGGCAATATPKPGCRGIPNTHSALAMKSLSPSYDQDFADMDEYGSSFYDVCLLDSERFSKLNYSSSPGSYGVFDHSSAPSQPNCYHNNDQVTPTPPPPPPAAPTTDGTNVTALNKSLDTLTNLNLDETWQVRHPSLWDHSQVTQFVLHVCERNQLDYERVRMGTYEWDGVTGNTLLSMNKHEFQARFHYGGTQIYDALQEFRLLFINLESENSCYPYDEMFGWTGAAEIDNTFINHCNNSINTTVIGSGRIAVNGHDHLQSNQSYTNRYLKIEVDSDVESNQSYVNGYQLEHSSNQTHHDGSKLLRRKPGRPPNKEKKNKSKNGQRNSRLWEFIRDLLLDSKTCPSLLKWENADEGIFRFVQSDRVARLWGERKCNPRMTYEKLSRAMRYYYKSQVFLPVIGRRLVYRFGPNATGWRPNQSLLS